MPYTGSVGIMPGAATEKLPFIHSNFKARSKFAKCFGGFKKFPGQHGGVTVTNREFIGRKLPQIRYSGFEEQDNVLEHVETQSVSKKEYSGFTGGKITAKKREDDPNFIRSDPRKKPSKMKSYLSLPNLSALNKHGGSLVSHLNTEQTIERVKGQTGHQINDQDFHDAEYFNRGEGHDLDSLIFYDEDITPYQHAITNHTALLHQTKAYGEAFYTINGVHFAETEYDSLNGSVHSTSHPAHLVMSQTEVLAKGVYEKIKDARGKSGMKRGKRQDPNRARVLGDVITSERLKEILKPKKDEGPLTFAV